MKTKYWYKYYYYYCPVCCRETMYKERQYDNKPKDYSERHIVVEHYDYCGEG